MERNLFGMLFTLFGLTLWSGAAAATSAGTVIEVSGSCTDHGRVLNRGDAVSVASESADWFIRAQAGSAQVGVLTGIVDLRSTTTRQSVSIPAHWGTRLETGLDPVLPRIWAHTEFDAVTRLTGG